MSEPGSKTTDEPLETKAASAPRKISLFKQSLPWLLTFGLLFYLFRSHSPAAAWGALKEAELGLVLPLWVVAAFVVFVADTACITQLFQRLNKPVEFRSLFQVKGASYLLNIINYNAALGGIALFVSRKTKVPFLEVFSSMLLLTTLDMVVLIIYMAMGFVLLPSLSESPYYVPVGLIIAGIGAVYLGALVYWNGGFNFLFFGRLRSWSIFRAFRVARLRDHGALLVMRFVFMSLYFFTQYISLHLFDIPVPLLELFVYNAILAIVGTLPISVPGLGATQVVMIILYAPYGNEAQVLAYSTSIAFVFILVRGMIGYRFVGRVTKSW